MSINTDNLLPQTKRITPNSNPTNSRLRCPTLLYFLLLIFSSKAASEGDKSTPISVQDDDLAAVLYALGAIIVLIILFAICKCLCSTPFDPIDSEKRRNRIKNLIRLSTSHCHSQINDKVWEEAFPSVTFNPKKHHDSTCPICFKDFNAYHQVRRIKICKHLLHTTCLEKSLSYKEKCPVCRRSISLGAILSYNFLFHPLYAKLRDQALKTEVVYQRGRRVFEPTLAKSKLLERRSIVQDVMLLSRKEDLYKTKAMSQSRHSGETKSPLKSVRVRRKRKKHSLELSEYFEMNENASISSAGLKKSRLKSGGLGLHYEHLSVGDSIASQSTLYSVQLPRLQGKFDTRVILETEDDFLVALPELRLLKMSSIQ